MVHESRPPRKEGGEANQKNGIEAEGFGQNPQELEEEEALNFLDKKTREVLFGRLADARRAYAEAEVRIDKVKGDATAEIMEAERMRSAYRGAINDIRDYYQRHIAADALLSPEQKAQKIHEIVLETTTREANRLFNLKTDIKIKEREEAAEQRIAHTEEKSFLGEVLFANTEAAKAAGRLALKTAEAYRNLPIKYKLLLSGALAGGSIAAGALALPTLAIGMGLGVSIQRILGGGAAAIGMETWRRGKQEKKSEKEVAREIERQGDLLTALLRADNQERLNDLMFEQAGRKGWERNKRMALAGVTFAAIATGLPGMGIRTGASYLSQSETTHTVMNYLGITDDLKDRVWASADGIKKSIKGFFIQEGVAYAAESQSGGTSGPAPATGEGLGTKIKRGLLSVVGADNPEKPSRPAGSGATTTETPQAPRIPPEVKRAISTDLADQKTWRENMQVRGISEEAIKESMRHQEIRLFKAYPDTEAGRKEMERYIENTWTTKARDVLKDPDLVKKYAMYSENLREYNERQHARASGTKASSETKPDTAPNEPPPQKTQPVQPGGREEWDPAQKKWVPKGQSAAKPPPVPTGEGRSPYASPAEGAKTAPPRVAAVEAPPKTQTGTEKLPPQSTRPETSAPKNAAEVAARARAIEMTTVRKGEGAWQAVRRQFYERMRTEPQKFGMTPEHAAKLPEDIDKLGKGTKAAKLLNRETLATLKKAGYINPDGTTKFGITKPGVRVFLTPDNSIELQGEGKLKYEMTDQRPKTGTAPERAGRPRGGAAESSGHARTRGALPQERGSVRQSFDLNKEPPLPEVKARLEDAESYGGRAAADKIESANLKEFGLKPQELKNISEMEVKAFMDEMDRHETEIRTAARSPARRGESIFINKGPFTARGFSADIPEARKYLDLSERLEKYMKPFDKATRQAILKEPVGKLLRALSFEK